jgi:hypothetical protein
MMVIRFINQFKYNKIDMQASTPPIKDDVSVVEAALKKTRASFQSGKTRSIQFRIQ